jgi:large subunit ribosomal protein L32
MRRAHDALKRVNLVACQNCQVLKLPHRVCPNCGFYNGRVVEGIAKED